MTEKDPVSHNFHNFFPFTKLWTFSGEEGRQIGVRSTDPNCGGAQLAAGRQHAIGVHRGKSQASSLGFHALSLAILGLARPTTALPLTSPALLPSVTGWDCSDPLNLTVSDASGRYATTAAATSEINSKKCGTRAEDNYFLLRTPGILRSKGGLLL